MKIERFIELLDYKPKYVTDPCKFDDDVRMIEFRSWKNFSASIEFGTSFRKKENGYYFYFEVLDMNGYKEMDFISLDSNRRHDVIFCWPKTDDDYKKLAKLVNDSLRKMHKK